MNALDWIFSSIQDHSVRKFDNNGDDYQKFSESL